MHKIGIIGLGHLGEIHLKQWLEIVSKEQIYCFDTNLEPLNKITDTYLVNKSCSYDELLSQCDIIDIVTPTIFHFQYAKLALENNKHVFIEKPVCETEDQVQILIELQKKSKTLVQIGHVERYNPAYTAIESQLKEPLFFEVHRISPFISRGTEVSVIMDLMIHDLDIILHLVDSAVKNVYANGVSIVSNSPDIANVRIEFENGCIANLTASRISMKKMRKMRIFSKRGYSSIDFLEKKSESMEIYENNESVKGLEFVNNEGKSKKLVYKEYNQLEGNAIYLELCDFFNAILSRKNDTKVNLINSYKTLKIANLINKKVLSTNFG